MSGLRKDYGEVIVFVNLEALKKDLLEEQVCLQLQCDFIANKIDYIMLNLLTITLLLAACIFCQVADPTADKVGSPVDLKTLYPIKHYHKMGSWSYITVDGVKYIQGTVPAGFYTFDVSLWLRNQYKLQNKKRAWYTHRCQAYKNATKQWSEDYLVTRDIESSDVEFFSSSGIHLGFYSEHMRHNTLKGIFVETECNRIFRAKYSTVYN